MILTGICSLQASSCIPFGKGCILLGDGSLCYCKNGKALALLCSLVDGIYDLVNIVWYLRKQNDVCTARNTCVQCEPAYLVAHNLNDKYTVVGCCCGVDAVDCICSYIDRALEAKGHICAVDIIVDCLWQMNDIKSLFPEKIGCLLCAVSAQNNETVKTKLLVCVFMAATLSSPFSSGTLISLKGCLDEPSIVPPFVRMPENPLM